MGENRGVKTFTDYHTVYLELVGPGEDLETFQATRERTSGCASQVSLEINTNKNQNVRSITQSNEALPPPKQRLYN